jgi:eukaryotic-like serine/threonine-protein kinase
MSVRTLPFRVKKYECTEDLHGNMAEVYLAQDTRTGRRVVVKLLRREDCAHEELRARFLVEAQLACQVNHPNIITTYDTDEDEGQPYIVMEYLEGEGLRALMSRGGITTQEQALGIALQTARALAYLHRKGIVHRDLKPDNLICGPDGRIKLLDFGVARRPESNLTMAGQSMGTPSYMSPEQVRGERATPASDIYSFGVMLYEMLTTQKPFRAETTDQLFAAILHAQPDVELLRHCRVPESVASLTLRCIDKKIEERPARFEDVSAVLRPFAPQWLAEEDTGNRTAPARVVARPRPKWLWPAVGGGVLAVLAFGTFLWMQRAPAPQIDAKGGRMMLVPEGAALLGADLRSVPVKGFYIDQTEVANRDYLQFCRDTGRAKPPGIDNAPQDRPVVQVTFEDAQAFATWAGKRLPSADEWEKAARGEKGKKFPWGGEVRWDDVNVPRDEASETDVCLAPVNSRTGGASPYGALNLLGNVWEWVSTSTPPSDDEFARLSSAASALNPPLARDEPVYQIRGGSCRQAAGGADGLAELVWHPVSRPARMRGKFIGFRCARDVR